VEAAREATEPWTRREIRTTDGGCPGRPPGTTEPWARLADSRSRQWLPGRSDGAMGEAADSPPASHCVS
jgi:hypothetical protein